MYLSDVQKQILKLVKEYGCLRIDQLKGLIIDEYPKAMVNIDIRQLMNFNLISILESVYVSFGRVHSDSEPNEDVIDAVDVLLTFSQSQIQLKKLSVYPFILTFFKDNPDGKLYRYDIVRCHIGDEMMVSSSLENINQKYRIIILLLDSSEQIDALEIACECFYAVRENGKYEFYR